MTKGLFHRERVQELVVDVERVGQRIDNFLICKLKPVPRGHIYRILRRGEVRVNKGRIKPTYRLCEGDRIRVPPLSGVGQGSSSPHLSSKHVEERLRNAILYQDKGLIVINKPSGLAVHGGSGLAFGVIEIMRSLFPQFDLELVHRLDRETSGCLLIAKKRRVLRELHELLRGDGMDKRYCALVKGRLPAGTRKVSAPLLKNVLSSGERIVKVAPSGKPSLTLFTPLQHFDNATLVEARPKTGRTHQIRVHATHIGQPIACDEKYGARDFNQTTRELGLRRLFLHAQSLTFQLSDWQQPLTVEASMEPNLSRCLTLLKNSK